MNFKDIIPSEISQSQKEKYYIIPLILILKTVKFIEGKNRMVVARSWGEEKGAANQCVYNFGYAR